MSALINVQQGFLPAVCCIDSRLNTGAPRMINLNPLVLAAAAFYIYVCGAWWENKAFPLNAI